MKKSNLHTAKASLIRYLLEGRVLNIRNCVKEIGLTNAPREVSRMIEQPFGVIVSRTPRAGKNRYGVRCTWVDYRLNRSEHNMEGIKKMTEYLAGHSEVQTTPKKKYTQTNLFDE